MFWKKKKNDEIAKCNCSVNNQSKNSKEEIINQNESTKRIKILGSGCSNCVALERATIKALSELNINEEIDHVTDFSQIASYGVMRTPALVFENKVLSYGKVLEVEEIKELLSKEINNL